MQQIVYETPSDNSLRVIDKKLLLLPIVIAFDPQTFYMQAFLAFRLSLVCLRNKNFTNLNKFRNITYKNDIK